MTSMDYKTQRCSPPSKIHIVSKHTLYLLIVLHPTSLYTPLQHNLSVLPLKWIGELPQRKMWNCRLLSHTGNSIHSSSSFSTNLKYFLFLCGTLSKSLLESHACCDALWS